MSHRYDSLDLVTLPSLGVLASVALGREVITVAKLPEAASGTLVRAKNRLVQTHALLQQASKARFTQTAGDANAQRDADHDVDGTWASLHRALEAWALLPSFVEDPRRAAAEQVVAALFPDGLKFLNLPYKLEWAESEMRLSRIDEGDLAARIEGIVGNVFLPALREAHKAYGKALGVTDASGKPSDTVVAVREPLNAFRNALRQYVVQVVALEDGEDEASRAVVDALLAPVTSWRSRRRGATADETPADETPTTDPPAPGP